MLSLFFLLFDPLPLLNDMLRVARIRAELPHAMERWESQGITSYQVIINGFIPLVCMMDGELTIQDGQLVQVRIRENALVPETPLRMIDPSDWDTAGCAYHDLTVEAMFDRVEAALQQAGLLGAPLWVTFDGTMGYITEYRSGRSSGGGILEPKVSECCTWLAFSGLTAEEP